MEAGTYLLEMQPSQLTEVALGVVHSMQSWARDKHIALQSVLSSDLPPWVMTDPNRITQVLANFVSNALKFVDQSGAGRIQVRVFPLDPVLLEQTVEGEVTTEIPTQEATTTTVGTTPAASRAAPSAAATAPVAPAGPGPVVAGGWRHVLFTTLARLHLVGQPLQHPQQPSTVAPTGDIHPEESREIIAPLRFGHYFRRGSAPTQTSTTADSSRGTSPPVHPPVRSPVPPSNNTTVVDIFTSDGASSAGSPTLRPSPDLEMGAGTATPIAPASPMSTMWIRIEVEDNGVGITSENLSKLWRPFSQIEAGIRQQGKGSGLGLHICKEIIRHHGGRVGVRSVPGQGSTFFADIPFRVCSRPASDTIASQSSSSVPKAASVASTTTVTTTTVATAEVLRLPASVVDHLVILVVDDGTCALYALFV
jgi:hypothetical protein